MKIKEMVTMLNEMQKFEELSAPCALVALQIGDGTNTATELVKKFGANIYAYVYVLRKFGFISSDKSRKGIYSLNPQTEWGKLVVREEKKENVYSLQNKKSNLEENAALELLAELEKQMAELKKKIS